ncbi:unnamed protein product [Euphydryas editha]|uniref:Endonuclease-reverse transcriptase n=1 Tax=Euphydryas editha TaxID=104508 RepID=A0AAU9V113_EUPED|nr:unnamed protein product [Euphydryas editha]
MKEMETNITKNITKTINDNFKTIELKYDQLNKQLQTQENILDRIERHNRRKNLVFFGIEEGEKTYQELESKILYVISNMNIHCERNEIESVKRLGRKSEKPRPITVTFTTMGKKITLLQNKKNMKNSAIYFKEDYPLKVLEKRKQLQTEILKYKAEEKHLIKSRSCKRAYRELRTYASWISSLTENSTSTTSRDNILKIATKFYENLYDQKSTCDHVGPQSFYTQKESTTIVWHEREIAQEIKKLKPEKSPGPDGIPNEAIKLGTTILTPVITMLFNKITEEQRVPEQWTKSNIILLYKKGTYQSLRQSGFYGTIPTRSCDEIYFLSIYQVTNPYPKDWGVIR